MGFRSFWARIGKGLGFRRKNPIGDQIVLVSIENMKGKKATLKGASLFLLFLQQIFMLTDGINMMKSCFPSERITSISLDRREQV